MRSTPAPWAAAAAAIVAGAGLTGCGTTITRELKPDPLPQPEPVTRAQFRDAMEDILGLPFTSGNAIATLENGSEIFPSMLQAIRSARETVNFESFIFWPGQTPSEFAEALAGAARRGVEVRVLLDWLGSQRADSEAIDLMKEAGVRVARYNAPTIFNPFELNYRTHRKVLVVDGRVGFTGGVGIGDEWRGRARNPSEWRETHYRAEGPVVGQLQAIFADNWREETDEILAARKFFPKLEHAGSFEAVAVMSSPPEGGDSIYRMYLFALRSAQRNIRIVTPYFLPDDNMKNALIDAARRGASVEVIVPGRHVDWEMARAASRAEWGDLFAAGIRIYEYQPTMLHSKLLVIDDYWTTVGSANLDNRSFSLNDESNLAVYDRRFAADQNAIFEADKADSREITFEEWSRRPLADRLKEAGSFLFKTQL